MQHNVCKMMADRIVAPEIAVKTVGQYGERSVINKRFSAKGAPIVRHKGLQGRRNICGQFIVENKLAVAGNKIGLQGSAVYSECYECQYNG